MVEWDTTVTSWDACPDEEESVEDSSGGLGNCSSVRAGGKREREGERETEKSVILFIWLLATCLTSSRDHST